jgi:hypothetical protein
MNEKQDQRPVYMGTFSKYTKTFESKIALMENDIEYHKKVIKQQTIKLKWLNNMLKANLIIIGIALLAILMLQILS